MDPRKQIVKVALQICADKDMPNPSKILGHKTQDAIEIEVPQVETGQPVTKKSI